MNVIRAQKKKSVIRFVVVLCLVIPFLISGCGGDNGNDDVQEIEITGVKLKDIKSDSAVVSWQTNVKTQSLIGYGKSTNYELFVEDEEFRTAHSLKLTGLEPETEYHYEITSFNSGGNSISDFDRTFFTVPE